MAKCRNIPPKGFGTDKPSGVSDDPNPKDAFGKAKPSLHAIPPSALIHLGAAMANGERKYGLMNFRETRVEALVYADAALRHILKYLDGENIDADVNPATGEDRGSGLHPLAHVMACCAIILDAELQGTLIDNRGPIGKVDELIALMTKV